MNKDYKLITKEELEKLNNFIKNVQPKNKDVFKRTKKQIEICSKMMGDESLVKKTN